MSARWKRWAWPALAALAALALRLPSLNLLLDRDEGEYATLAWLWRGNVGLPYRDWLEQKPPLAIAMNDLAQRLCADGVLGLRALSLAWIAATVLALYFLVERLASRGRLGGRLGRSAESRSAVAGLCALAAAVLLSGCRTQALAANTETWQALPLAAAFGLLFCFEGASGPRRYAAAGVCIGVASLFKQPALAAVFLLPWAAQERDGALLPSVGWTLAGALLPWAAAWGVFEAQGAGLDFLNCVVAYNQGYVAQGFAGAPARALGLARGLLPELGAWAGLAVLGWRALGRERARRRWLAAWLLLGLVSLSASGRFYPHYAVGLLAPLALLAGFGLAGLFPEAPGWSRLRFPRALRWGLLAWAALGYAWCDGVLWLRPGAEARTFHLYGMLTFVNAPLAARRLEHLCPPGKSLFVWGDEAELYYLAQRKPASRFLFIYPFTGEAPPWPGGGDELLASLLNTGTGAAALAQGLDANDPLQKRILDALNGQYSADHSVHGFVLGARRR